jgi:nucleoside 2-deoxyribosyltransferase
MKMRVFLAAPFTRVMDETGRVESWFKQYLMGVYDSLIEQGYEVINAHLREQWGERLDAPDQALALDLAGIDRSDALVALVGMAPSPGVQLEIGYAVGREKPIVVVESIAEHQPYLVAGLPNVARAVVTIVDDLAETEAAVKDGLERLL